jgi:hypothetical protein
MLQARRSRLDARWGHWIFFFSLPNPSSRTMALESTQPLIEMSTRNLPGGKGRPAYKADNLTAVSRLSRKCGNLDVSQSSGPSRHGTGIALPFTLLLQDAETHDNVLSP